MLHPQCNLCCWWKIKYTNIRNYNIIIVFFLFLFADWMKLIRATPHFVTPDLVDFTDKLNVLA